MSLVSEAHRRANGESAIEERAHTSNSVVKWALSLVVATALGSVATIGFMKSVLAPETETESVQSMQSALDHTPSRSGAGSAGQQSPETAPRNSAEITALYERAKREREAIEQPAASQVASRGSRQPEVSDITEASSTAALVAVNSTSSDIDEEQLLARARSLLANNQRDVVLKSTLPTIETLSAEVRDSVPTLLYSAHDYQAQGGSKVMINRQWRSEGQDISGIKIIEIREKSTVFETANGVRFLQPAVSSWVNL